MHALIVGGTGMLKGVVLKLNREGWKTTVVARNRDRMDRLIKEAERPRNIGAALVDWHDAHALIHEVSATREAFGPYNLCVLWMHSSAQSSLAPLLEAVADNGAAPWDLYHIKGSAASRPDQNWKPKTPSGCNYHEIILGFKLEDGGESRWLTHREIAGGTLEAIQSGCRKKIIGMVEPWEKRPGW
ncbi:short-chain dehydrogenase [Camelliibacillus cellulosilyticus]|uniref:Short-chain dehydrogenase n=1 Tax=Camelliibacillus cellulosilyticus TaxID=2174486 RepID=A0ABV9GMZ0_9BACL